MVEGAVAADIVFLCPGCTLPSGLQVNPRTGQLYGLPTAVGVFPGTVIVARQKYARRQRHAHPCALRNYLMPLTPPALFGSSPHLAYCGARTMNNASC